jgi:transglutaminase-like putative cysteine protease
MPDRWRAPVSFRSNSSLSTRGYNFTLSMCCGVMKTKTALGHRRSGFSSGNRVLSKVFTAELSLSRFCWVTFGLGTLLGDLRVGDTIEYSYSLNGQNPVFGGKFFAAAVWDQGYPTTLRSVILSYPVARKINWRFIGRSPSKLLAAAESTRDGMHTLRFAEESIPQVTVEPLHPLDYGPLRELQFSEFSRWDEVVNWASELFKVPTKIDDDVRQVVEKIRERPGTEERVVAALEFVQSEIRYFSVALGESSHRPYPPSLVLQRRYGDCKDKSFLLMTLLTELGVRSDAVLLKVGQHKGIDELRPSPQVFNHAIVGAYVNGKIYYLDPTRLGSTAASTAWVRRMKTHRCW